MRWLALVVLVSACGGAPKPRCMMQGGHDWFEVQTEHFELVTNLSEEKALAKAAQLEQTYLAIVDLSSALILGEYRVGERIRVLHFRDYWEYLALGRENTLGYATSRRDGSSMRAIVTPGKVPVLPNVQTRSKPSHVLRHELMHAVVDAYVPYPRPWLNEGLAEFVETLEVKDGKAILGGIPPSHVNVWLSRGADLPSLSEVIQAGPVEFYGGKLGPFAYFSAWRLVHFLNNSSTDRHERFRAYLGALMQGSKHSDAWAGAFGDVSKASLSKSYRRYKGKLQLKLWTTPYEYQSLRATPSIRFLREGEVHAAWGELATSGKKKLVERQLGLMLDHDPVFPEQLLWQAVLEGRLLKGAARSKRVLELLRRYVNKQERDARAWELIVSTRLSREVPGGYLGIDGDVPAAVADMEQDVRNLLRVATQASQLNTVAWYYALSQQPEIGLNFSQRSLEASPSCGNCYDTLALLLFQLGRVDEALDAQERAVGMAPHGGASKDMLKRLSRYRKAAIIKVK